MQFDWLSISKGHVVLPDDRIDFDSFDVSVRPVSTNQYANFAEATGYLTYVERERKRYTYRRNTIHQELLPYYESEGDIPAVYLTIEDIRMFTNWVGLELPTIAQALVTVSLFTHKFMDKIMISGVTYKTGYWSSDIVPALDGDDNVVIIDSSQMEQFENVWDVSMLISVAPPTLIDPRMAFHVVRNQHPT